MKKFLKNIVLMLILIIIAICIFNMVYSKLGYGYFSKAATVANLTLFTKDNSVKYSNEASYKIENKDYNNSAFYKKVKVKKNTPYKITCMIKTDNVVLHDNNVKNSGAKISILNSQDQTNPIVGTNDWQKVTLLVNSKNSEELEVAFMLGGDTNKGNVKGSVWFSNLKIEEGSIQYNNNWNFVCFIFKNTDVDISGKNYKYQMYQNDLDQIYNCMERFKNTCEDFSENQININYEIIELDNPIDSLSYDEDNGYYIDSSDISSQIDRYLDQTEFDHIFVCARLTDNYSKIPINNWLGLGSMEYRGIGFSNIRMPTSSKSYELKYKKGVNTFPEEVFIHEFIHTLERNSSAYGYKCPALHENLKYGYEEKEAESLYKWYKDYMSGQINYNGEKIGINSDLYKLKPVHESNFYNSIKLADFDEPTDLIGKGKLLINTIKSKI